VKTERDWDNILNELYWNVEHGEHRLAIKKLAQFEADAFRAGMTRAAEIADNEQLADMAEGNFATQAVIVDAILKARDAITTLDGK